MPRGGDGANKNLGAELWQQELDLVACITASAPRARGVFATGHAPTVKVLVAINDDERRRLRACC